MFLKIDCIFKSFWSSFEFIFGLKCFSYFSTWKFIFSISISFKTSPTHHHFPQRAEFISIPFSEWERGQSFLLWHLWHLWHFKICRWHFKNNFKCQFIFFSIDPIFISNLSGIPICVIDNISNLGPNDKNDILPKWKKKIAWFSRFFTF